MQHGANLGVLCMAHVGSFSSCYSLKTEEAARKIVLALHRCCIARASARSMVLRCFKQSCVWPYSWFCTMLCGCLHGESRSV